MLNKIEKSVEIAEGKVVRYETGRLAKQAQGSVVVQSGAAMTLTTMCFGKEGDFPFFPLTVEYREKAYAAGKIPGGYLKREARPGDHEILMARLIDRPIRPMFPDNFNREVQVINNVLSADKAFAGDVFAIGAASLAIGLSEIPFEEQVACVRVVKIEDKFVVNPTFEEVEASDLELVMAGTASSVCMVEGGAWESSEAEIIAAIEFGHIAVKKLVAIQDEMIAELAPAKMTIEVVEKDEALYNKVAELVKPKLDKAFHIPMTKSTHYPEMDRLLAELVEELGEEYAERKSEVKEFFKDIERDEMRRVILEESLRIDGRGLSDIRPVDVEATVLPSAHGSAVFQRGETQALAATTLGSKSDEQRVDTLEGEMFKNYMLHYNFPPFSVGECKRVGSISRREIGHGHLAERSLNPVLPHPDDFPYTIRVVSEVLESNGSSSMATVCSGALSLMDAGVPIKAPVAGIAMGLIAEGDKTQILSDISGTEDHLGDMDFKVAGTTEGITAFQMDIKIKGITAELMGKALEQARAGRNHIIGEMNKVLATPRTELAATAPSVIKFKVNPAKIRDIIGPGGNVIRGIQSSTGTVVTIDDSGQVQISAPGRKAGQVAEKMVKEIVADVEVGKIYKGKVKNIVAFGAFIEVLPGKEGLVHISEMAAGRVEKAEDIVALGDEIEVKCIGVDPKGKIKLSIKALIPEEAPLAAAPEATEEVKEEVTPAE